MPKTPKKRRAWPEKRRAKQSENIKKTQPWKSATGPNTNEGKAKTAQNALKHGARSTAFTTLRKALHENQKHLDALQKSD